MEKITRRIYSIMFGHIISVVIVGALMLSPACVTPPEKAAPKQAGENAIMASPKFESNDYIIYMLQGGETPVTLAERFLGDGNRAWIIEQNNPGVSYQKDQIVVIPKRLENPGGLSLSGYQKVPVLCYHYFAESCNSSLCTTSNNFDSQMKYLKDNGYWVITLKELLGFLQYNETIPENAVVITIDDGYRSSYTIAYPILKKYGFVASLFVYTDFVGSCGNAVTWDQLREMKAHGFEVESHTLSHSDLRKKNEGEDDSAFTKRITREIYESKAILDKMLGQETFAMAFPYGRYDGKVLEICKEAGYDLGLTVKRGGNPFFAAPLRLRRSQVLEGDMPYFKKALATFQPFSQK